MEESHKRIVMKKGGPDEPQLFEEIILKCTPEYRLNVDDLRETMVPRLGQAPAPKGESQGKTRKKTWENQPETEWKKGNQSGIKKVTKKEKEQKGKGMQGGTNNGQQWQWGYGQPWQSYAAHQYQEPQRIPAADPSSTVDPAGSHTSSASRRTNGMQGTKSLQVLCQGNLQECSGWHRMPFPAWTCMGPPGTRWNP